MTRLADQRRCAGCGLKFQPTHKRRAARFCSRACSATALAPFSRRQRRSNDVLVVGEIAHVDVSTPRCPTAIARIDAADLDLVIDGRGRWYAARSEGHETPYAYRWLVGTNRDAQALHRVILGLAQDDPIRVDHRDADGLNNRRENLRPASASQNAANILKRRPRSSRFKGVSYHRRDERWCAAIRAGGRLQHLGAFKSEEDAARAYDVAAVRHFGDFARTNFG